MPKQKKQFDIQTTKRERRENKKKQNRFEENKNNSKYRVIENYYVVKCNE